MYSLHFKSIFENKKSLDSSQWQGLLRPYQHYVMGKDGRPCRHAWLVCLSERYHGDGHVHCLWNRVYYRKHKPYFRFMFVLGLHQLCLVTRMVFNMIISPCDWILSWLFGLTSKQYTKQSQIMGLRNIY